MSRSTLAEQPLPLPAPARTPSLVDLLTRLGSVPADRVLADPPPGTATERDVLALRAREGRLAELVDGVLVEKAVGFLEAFLAARLLIRIGRFVEQRGLGITAGADGMVRLGPGLVRIPDVSYVSWGRLPGGRVPAEPIPDLVPDLAVEVLSGSNSAAEMDRKVGEYLSAGVRLVWLVDAASREVRVFAAGGAAERVTDGGTLEGGAMLPGFALAVSELFAAGPPPA